MTERAAVVASRALAVLLAVVATGCGSGGGTACPAIGYLAGLTVRLEGWPAAAGRDAQLECPECGSPTNGTPGTTQTLPIGTEVSFTLYGAAPEAVTVRVLDENGLVVAELTEAPEFVRVGGSEECGGPTAAVVVVPAP